ncbi:UrcA family protein [Sphingomonas sp. GCM10030256]|uniref:UrcA family protein n=1 Tax=Sphingomonas sp. GCM10030256 TaxID=3273427 RepID=UPI0036175388
MARLPIGLCAFCLLAAVPVQGGAVPPETVVTAPSPNLITRTVSFADLDLGSAAGRSMLNRRVDRAVRTVCAEALGPSPIFYAQTACHKASWGDSRPQIDRALHGGVAAAASATIIVVVAAK